MEQVKPLKEVQLTNIEPDIKSKSKVMKRAPKVFTPEKDKTKKYFIKRERNNFMSSKNRKIQKEKEKKNKILLKSLEESNKELSYDIYDLKKEMKILCKYVKLKHF